MSTRDTLRKCNPRTHKRSLAVLMLKSGISGLKDQIAAIKDLAKKEFRELGESEGEQIALIDQRIAKLEADLAGAEQIFKDDKADDILYIQSFSGIALQKYLDLSKSYGDRGASVPSGEIAALGLREEDGSVSYESEKDVADLCGRDGQVLNAIALETIRVSGRAPGATEEAEKK